MPVLRWAWRGIRSAPLTVGYLIVLSATTVLLSVASTDRADRLLDTFSTNLHQLGRAPLRVLVGSAFWTSGWFELTQWVVLFFAVLAPVERRLGRRRTLLAFAVGHVGATLMVAAGLWLAVQFGTVAPTVAFARDVGVSYGFFSVAALAAYLLARRVQLCYLTLLIGYVTIAAAMSHTFTDFGHMTAVAIGLVWYPLRRSSWARTER
jgi:membrane associated rhomboid family serine protease